MILNKPAERPQFGKFLGFHHVVLWVGNAKQAAAFYTSRLGFEYLAYKGLESGERDFVAHVVCNNKIVFEFQSSYDPEDKLGIGEHVKRHGDGVKDVVFEVEDCRKVFDYAIQRGAIAASEPQEIQDEHGKVIIATLKVYNDTIHTLVQKANYKGPHLPGYKAHYLKEAFNKLLEPVDTLYIDHIVCNHPEGDMEPTAQ